MALFKNKNLGDAVEDLLERERQAVLAGNLEVLTRLISEKTRMMALLKRTAIPQDQLTQLRRKAQQNQGLLKACARGIKSAATHISGLHAEKAPLRTYDSFGSSREILQRRSTLEKRS